MADNSLRTPGAGETIASDDVGGVKFQRVKIGLGVDGTADDMLGNTQGTLLASAARTAGVNSAAQTNYNARGVVVYLNVTVASGTGGLTVRVLGTDPVSSVSASLNAAPTAVTTTGIFAYELYPGAATASGNVAQRTSGSLPRVWLAQMQVGDASSYTYSLGYALIL